MNTLHHDVLGLSLSLMSVYIKGDARNRTNYIALQRLTGEIRADNIVAANVQAVYVLSRGHVYKIGKVYYCIE